MNSEARNALGNEKWARRLLIGATVATGLLFLADAVFDFIPEETAPSPAGEVILSASIITLAALGNDALKKSEATD